jgi:hypothetical protein
MSLSAPPPAIFPDLATGFEAIQAYAKQHGYALFKRDAKPNKVVVYACDRAGQCGTENSHYLKYLFK